MPDISGSYFLQYINHSRHVNGIVEMAVVLSASGSSFFKPVLSLEGAGSKTGFGTGTDEILGFDG